MKYAKTLEELISLLVKSGENHWANYFSEALKLYKGGNLKSSYKKVLGAYGGMDSFNDIVLNFITDEEVERVLKIKTWLYSYSKTHKKGIFGF